MLGMYDWREAVSPAFQRMSGEQRSADPSNRLQNRRKNSRVNTWSPQENKKGEDR